MKILICGFLFPLLLSGCCCSSYVPAPPKAEVVEYNFDGIPKEVINKPATNPKFRSISIYRYKRSKVEDMIERIDRIGKKVKRWTSDSF